MITVKMQGIENENTFIGDSVDRLPIGAFVGKLGCDTEEQLYIATGGRVIQLSTPNQDVVIFGGGCKVQSWRPVDLEIMVREKK